MRNKKAQWMWLVGAIIAIGVLVVTWVITGRGLGAAKSNIDPLQSCEGRGGRCVASEDACNPDETAFYKSLGCGGENNKGKDWCCLPPPK